LFQGKSTADMQQDQAQQRLRILDLAAPAPHRAMLTSQTLKILRQHAAHKTPFFIERGVGQPRTLPAQTREEQEY
jgi:hypothetical protein